MRRKCNNKCALGDCQLAHRKVDHPWCDDLWYTKFHTMGVHFWKTNPSLHESSVCWSVHWKSTHCPCSFHQSGRLQGAMKFVARLGIDQLKDCGPPARWAQCHWHRGMTSRICPSDSESWARSALLMSKARRDEDAANDIRQGVRIDTVSYDTTSKSKSKTSISLSQFGAYLFVYLQ